MIFRRCFIYVFAITSYTDAVRVNMHGSLNLGKDVMNTITRYLHGGYRNLLPFRRSLDAELDPIVMEVRTRALCKDLDFCKGKMEPFVNEYVVELARTISGIFEGILNQEGASHGRKPFFVKELRNYLNEVRKMLEVTDEKVTDEREGYLWTGVVKKISAKFLIKTLIYIVDKLEADPQEIEEIKKKLTQSLVIDIVAVESKALKRLCHEYHMCLEYNDCTTSLNTLLGRLRKQSKGKIKSFLIAFEDALDDTTFYSKLSPQTAKEFKTILKDMANVDNVPTKDILNSIQETVEKRINTMNTGTELSKGQDVQLVHMILSDMDYMANKRKHKANPFRHVLDDFLEWFKASGSITSQMKDAVKSIAKVVSFSTQEMIDKLLNEVRVFLEITVDPEK